jgi:hypothetical protein
LTVIGPSAIDDAPKGVGIPGQTGDTRYQPPLIEGG